MTTLSAAELLLLRDGHPHRSKFYLTVFQPAVVYTGQVTGAPVRGARTITVSDISGNITSIEEGFTVHVLDADGNLVSKRRYRSRVGQVLKFDENTVVWSNTQTVKVYKQRELWTKYPFIDADDGYKFYKDRDISYAAQNKYIPPVAIAGSPKVGFLEAGTITFDLDGSDSYVMSAYASSIITYAWSCDGGTIANAALATTTITFTTPGEYTVKLTITDNVGTTQSTYRMIRVHERTGVHAPLTNFELDAIDSSWSQGGCSSRLTIREADLDYIVEGSYIIIWSETWYGDTKQNIGNFNNIRFAGYILSDSTDKTIKQNEVSFEIGTIDSLMKMMKMFSVSLEAVKSGDNAITWYQFPYDTLTIARAAHHLWKWHSTLLEIVDVYLPVDNLVKLTTCDDMSDGNLYTLLDWVYNNGIFAKVVCDQTGTVHLVKDVLLLGETARNANTVEMDITSKDRRAEDDIQIERHKESRAAYVLASGVAFVGSVFTPLMSQAPGEVPNNIGDDVVNVERLALLSQAELNEISGRLYAISNAEISEIRLSLAGDYPIDVTEQNWFTLHIPAAYTKRGIDVDVRMVCREVSYMISIASGTIYPSCVFDIDVDSVDGITVVYTENPEQPYAPIAPYVPYIPYLPNIPPIYPIVPSQPYPYPGGAPTTPPDGELTPIQEIDPSCNTDVSFPANGPFSTGMSGEITTRLLYPVRFWLRGTDSGGNYTRYTINGLFQNINVNGDYVATMDDDFYTVYAVDCTLTRVATGIHDTVSADGYQRTGYFSIPAGVNICYIEIVLDTNSAALVSCEVTEEYLDCIPYASTTVGSFNYTYVDDVLTYQYAYLRGAVLNPPWGGDARLRLGVYSVFDWDVGDQWFDIESNIYSSVHTENNTYTRWKISHTLNVWDGNYVYGLHLHFNMKASLPGFNGVWLAPAHNIGPNSYGTQWMTMITTIKPVYRKLSVDDFLLWNVCRYSD